MEENIKLQKELGLHEEEIQTSFNNDELWLNVCDETEEAE